MDIEKICRICLELDRQTFNIYTSYYVKRNTLYSEMLSECTVLRPHIGDGLPHLICKECSKQLKRSYAFNILCVDSEKKLKQILANSIKQSIETNGEVKSFNFKEELKLEDGNIVGSCTQLEKDVTAIEDIKNVIKLEPIYNDDSCWDAEDDNILLGEIKSKKQNTEDKDEDGYEPKKKRGRKRRVFLDGELPPPPESKMPHQCDVCGKILSTKSNLKAHKVCHTDLRPYKCTDCPATFRGHSALFQHKRVHSGVTPYHCEYCPKQFGRRTGLVNHLRMHTGEKLYGCDICAKKFVQNAQLNIHMKRHQGDKTYLCQDCGKGFPIKAELRVHQRTHNGEKPYACHLCPKTFATSGNLSIHVRIHNKEIRYNCKECQRGFVTCSAYNVHVKRHKGQRDYHCECGKTFYTSSALKQHRVVHTGEKNFQCKICERKFTQGSHLSRHVKRDHSKTHSIADYKLLQDKAIDIQGVSSNREMLGILDKAISRLAQTGVTDKCDGS